MIESVRPNDDGDFLRSGEGRFMDKEQEPHREISKPVAGENLSNEHQEKRRRRYRPPLSKEHRLKLRISSRGRWGQNRAKKIAQSELFEPNETRYCYVTRVGDNFDLLEIFDRDGLERWVEFGKEHDLLMRTKAQWSMTMFFPHSSPQIKALFRLAFS